MQRLRGLFFVNSYVKGKYLTHDVDRVASFNLDTQITRAIAVNILLDLYKTAERIVSDAAAITMPVQLLVSGDDFVVHRQPQIDFYQRLRNPLKELHVLPGFYHDTLGRKTGIWRSTKCVISLPPYMLCHCSVLITATKIAGATALIRRMLSGDPRHILSTTLRIVACAMA